VRTHPLHIKDVKKFVDAAHDWAWNKGWSVETTQYMVADDMWEVELELTSKFRDRDFA